MDNFDNIKWLNKLIKGIAKFLDIIIIISLLLVCLKFTKQINWDFIWVMLPSLIGIGVVILFIIIIPIILWFKEKRRDNEQ